MDEGGASLVSDDYCMSPMLLLCLVLHVVFGLGTVQRNDIGESGSLKFMDTKELSLEDKGDLRLPRTTETGRELAVVEPRDPKDVLFASTGTIITTSNTCKAEGRGTG